MVDPRKLTDPGEADEKPHWVKVAVFPSATTAELVRQQLDGAEIPVAVINDQTGIFGPGFSGSAVLGVTILVQSGFVEEAREVVASFLDAFGGELIEDES